MPIVVSATDSGVRLRVHVQSRASRNEIVGEHDGALRVRLAAPPVDNAANEALVELLAKAFRIAKRDIQIVGGATSRRKVVEINGVDEDQVKALAPRAP